MERTVAVNNSVNQPPPGPPSADVPPGRAAGGRVLGSTQPAPLLVLACKGTPKNISTLPNRNMSPKRPAYSDPFGVFFP
jgi:hypothetical protein